MLHDTLPRTEHLINCLPQMTIFCSQTTVIVTCLLYKCTVPVKHDCIKYISFQLLLRRFPLNVRAVSAKIKLPKKYLQHCHILRTDKKNLSLLLLPS